MVFLDSNIPMYLVGADDEKRDQAEAILQTLIAESRKLVTDAEVYQEILHRYTAIGRKTMIQPAFNALNSLADEVFAIDLGVVEDAKGLVLAYEGLPARDAIHAAVMLRHQVSELLSFDSHLDKVRGINRISKL